MLSRKQQRFKPKFVKEVEASHIETHTQRSIEYQYKYVWCFISNLVFDSILIDYNKNILIKHVTFEFILLYSYSKKGILKVFLIKLVKP